MDAILNDKNYEYYLKYAQKFLTYKPEFTPYFKGIFLPGFTKWALDQKNGKSIGNGAMIRISAIGYLFNNQKDIINNAV